MCERAFPRVSRWPATLIAALLGGGLFLSDPAAAQTIVYTDPTDIVIHQGTDAGSYSEVISLDNSGVGDLFFNTHLGGSLRTIFAGVSSPGRINTTASVATPLESGATIGPVTLPSQSYGLGGGNMRASFGGADSGPWPEGVDRFVGVKMVRQPAPGETYVYYGWVRVAIDMTSNASHVAIKDWAYNSTANAPIVAGDTGGIDPPSAPEPPSVVLFAAAGAAVLLLRRRRGDRH